MSRTISFSQEALEDVEEACRWYARQAPGLDKSFVAELVDFTERIQAAPETFARIYKHFRCGRLNRFPYVVYYSENADHLEVTAVLHGSRDPKFLRKRLS